MTKMASQITSLTIVYSIVYSGAHQRKHQSPASLAFVRGIHRGPVNSPHKGPVTRKMFPFDDVIMAVCRRVRSSTRLISSHKGTTRIMNSRFVTLNNYNDIIMGAMASQITSLAIVYSTIYSGADQTKHQSSASLAFVRGIHRGPVNSPHKWLVTRKMFPFDDVIMITSQLYVLLVCLLLVAKPILKSMTIYLGSIQSRIIKQ